MVLDVIPRANVLGPEEGGLVDETSVSDARDPEPEVQVVDWGFAKVMRKGGIDDESLARKAERDRTMISTVRSGQAGAESIAGSVMGTPAYMPPEQALGHVEDLTERADVFSLGAILCEILTGAPPYGGNFEDVLTAAAQARLEALLKDHPRDSGAAIELARILADQGKFEASLDYAHWAEWLRAPEAEETLASIEALRAQRGAAGNAPAASE